MNNSYKIIDNKVFVYDDSYNEVERDFTNNIDEILITENNIEEIEDLITYYVDNNNLNTYQITMSAFLGLGTANIITAIYRLLTDGLSASLSNFLIATTFCTVSYPIGIKPYLKEKRNLKLKKTLLDNALSKEIEKLDKLNKDKSNDSPYPEETINIIFTSDEIRILKDRLSDIKLYMNNRSKFIKLYKKEKLDDLFYDYQVNGFTIEFLKTLIEFDLGIKTNLEYSDQKILRK